MIRPLPGGSNWSEANIVKYGVEPGAKLRFNSAGPASSHYPHRTEDTVIAANSVELLESAPDGWLHTIELPVTTTLLAAFNSRVRTTGTWNGAKKGAYVQKGTQIRSLAAVQVRAQGLRFFEDDYKGRKSFRAYLRDIDERYSLPVVAKDLRGLYRSEGIAAVNRSLPGSGNLHVRVGLARAWPEQPERCTVMINGVYW